MIRYWSMKVFQEWWDEFQTKKYIGIDEDGVDKSYLTMNDKEINLLIEKGFLYGTKHRYFKQFCNYMNHNDLVIVGTGQTAKFNISGIVKIISDYDFDNKLKARHHREVNIIKVFDEPRPLSQFDRFARLEMIDENDFHDVVLSLI